MISILLVHSEYSSLSPLTTYIQKIFQSSIISDAFTLEEAGNICRTKHINLIFFDLDIHDTGNVTNFIQRLKQHIVTENIPIIFFTEAKKDEFYKKVAGLSGYDFIQKPIDKNMFILKLHNYSKIYTNIQIAKNGVHDSVIYTQTDTVGIITKVSTPMTKLCGYTEQELLGQSHNIIRHPSMSKSFYTNLWKKINEGSSWSGVIKNKRKDSTAYIVKATIYPLLDINNTLLGYASVQHDITKEMLEIQKTKKILDSQSSIIITFKNNTLTYVNNTFLHTYGFASLADFHTKHKCMSELFLQEDKDSLQTFMNNKTPWIDYIKENTHQKNLAYITDKFSTLHIYDVQYRGSISMNQEMYVFTDITHLLGNLHNIEVI